MEYIKLKNVAQIYLGLTHTPKYVDCGVPFLSVKDISGGEIDFSKCHYIERQEFERLPQGAKPKKGDLLFCRVGTIGKPIIIDESIPEFGTFVSLGFLRCVNSEYILEYLKYWMNSDLFFNQVKQNVKGVAQINLNTGWLKEFEIPVKSIKEQKEIVKKLDKINNIIDIKMEQLKNLDELIKSQFVEMFEKNKNFETLLVSEAIERGYIEKPLDGNHGNKHPKSSDYVESGIPFIMANNLKKGCVDLVNCNFISKQQAESLDKGFAKDNDVLITHKGTIGETAILHTDYEYVMLTPQITYYRTNNQYLLPEYLKAYFDSDIFQVTMKKIASSGSTRAYIGITEQRKLSLIIPPIELQKQYSDFIKQIDKQKFEIQKSLDEMQTIQESLMNKYFS